MQDRENASGGVLHRSTVSPDLSATIAEDAGRREQVNHWRSDASLVPFLENGPADEFNWADKRNERRRQREAQKRKKEREQA